MATDFPDFAPDVKLSDAGRQAIALLSSGGDARITLDPQTGLNRYMSAPYPRTALAFASSTANDLSKGAFDHVVGIVENGMGAYSQRLATLRQRICSAYAIGDGAEVVFAPSGTDLEYVALAAVTGRCAGGIHNILLGADEVGRGCVHSANGDYFASETALGTATEPKHSVEGLENVSLTDIAVRCEEGIARESSEILEAVISELNRARAMGKHALVHVVHGSKTGLILPQGEELDRLHAEFPGQFTLVVDACQARIASAAVHRYLERGAIVFLTGSKFMGGPPFSGFAILPEAMVHDAAPLPAGFSTIFRRAEWPAGWAGADILSDDENQGLALRLEASIFELEQFQRLPVAQVYAVIASFQRALATTLLQPFGLALVKPYPDGEESEAREHPIEMLTLATLDVSALPCARTFEQAETLHRTLALSGVRLGQPVKSVRTTDGAWAGTLRVGLSMGQISRWSSLSPDEQFAAISADLQQVAQAIENAAVVA